MISRRLQALLLATLGASAWFMLAGTPGDGSDEVPQLRTPRGGLQPVAAPASAPASAVPFESGAPRERQPWPAATAQALAAWSGPPPPAPAKVAAATRKQTPAPPAPFVPPPPPVAPPFPYELMGTVVEQRGGHAVPGALLNGAQNSLWVRAGDSVGADWRVQSVAAEAVELLWLPQRLPLTLSYRTP